MNETRNRPLTGRRTPMRGARGGRIRQTPGTQSNVTTSSPSSARKSISTPVSTSVQSKQQLEKIKADLNSISDRLNDVENKLPVIRGKSPTLDKRTAVSSARKKDRSARSVHTTYNAMDFNDEAHLKTIERSSDYLTRISNTLAENYDGAVMSRISGDVAERTRKNLVINIQQELREWKESHSKSKSVQTEKAATVTIKDDVLEEVPSRGPPALAVTTPQDAIVPSHPPDDLTKLDLDIILALVESFSSHLPLQFLSMHDSAV